MGGRKPGTQNKATVLNGELVQYLLDDNCFSMLEGETRTVRMTSLSDNKELGIKAYTLK